MKCVEDCGENFIYDQNCVTKCPETHQLVLESVVLGHSSEFTKLKFCSHKCPENTFKYQGFCEASCPNNALFSLDDNYCLDQCPYGYELFRNISNDNRTVSIRCMLNCSDNFPVRRGRFCIERCNQPLVQYKKECLDFCPADAKLTMKTSPFQDAIVNCIEACPDRRYLLNDTCVSNCPDNFAVYNDSVCVSECPANAPFLTEYIRSTTKFYKSHTKCVADCQELYIYNKTCVLLCPGYSLNKTCVNDCPLTSPFVCDQKQERLCKNSAYSQLYQTSLCLKTCPANMYAYNNLCVSYCPAALKSYNKACVEDCPQNAAYIEKSMFPPVCVGECPNQSFIDGYDCVQRCPENKLFILGNDSTCRENCPSYSPFVCDKRSEYACYSSDPSQYRTVLCLDACPGNMYVINNTCASKCPDEYKLYKNTCVYVCPIEAPITETKYCSWSNRHYGNCHPHSCVPGCSGSAYTDGLTCVGMCPDNKYALEINKTCVDKCPESQPLIYIDTSPRRCQNQCLEGSYFTDGKCVRFCKGNDYMFHNSCVRHCPKSRPFIKDRYCVPKCPQDWYMNKKECVEQCPQHLYIHNNLCLESCPSSHPFVNKDIFFSSSSCVEKCGYLEVSQEGICIYRSTCKFGIIFDDKCLQKCPHGYKWLNTHVNLTTYYPNFPVCHRTIVLSILFGLSLLVFLRFSYLYWKCFLSPIEYIAFFCCCSWICCKKVSCSYW